MEVKMTVVPRGKSPELGYGRIASLAWSTAEIVLTSLRSFFAQEDHLRKNIRITMPTINRDYLPIVRFDPPQAQVRAKGLLV